MSNKKIINRLLSHVNERIEKMGDLSETPQYQIHEDLTDYIECIEYEAKKILEKLKELEEYVDSTEEVL